MSCKKHNKINEVCAAPLPQLSGRANNQAHTSTHTHTHRHTGTQQELSNQAQAMATYDALMSFPSPHVFTYSYVIIIILAHSGTPTHSHTRTQHVILRALLSTLRAEAEAKAEQRMCFIGTFCTIAAPFLPSPSSYPHPSALNERGIAEESRGRRSWS